jgi:sec-independent protein translocase protein TatB
MKIGFTELMIVFVVALFVVGPDKLPEYARKFGEALAQFKKASDAATRDIKESIVEPLEEAQRPLREAMEPLEELNSAVNGNVKDVQKSFNNIGKTKKTTPSQAKETVKQCPQEEQEEAIEDSGSGKIKTEEVEQSENQAEDKGNFDGKEELA